VGINCWFCGGKMIWQSDANYDEVFAEGDGVVAFLTCSSCNAEATFSLKEGDEGND